MRILRKLGTIIDIGGSRRFGRQGQFLAEFDSLLFKSNVALFRLQLGAAEPKALTEADMERALNHPFAFRNGLS